MALKILSQFDDTEPNYMLDAEDMAFEKLQAVVPGMDVYFAEGTLDQDDDLGGTDLDISWDALMEFAFNFLQLGELADKPVSVKSSVARLKTRNNQVEGKRSTSIEIRLAGVGTKQKDYLENDLPTKDITIMILADEFDLIPDESSLGEPYPVIFLNGLRWTADVMGETDGLWTVVLSTEIQGCSADRIIFKHIIPNPEEEVEGGD